MWNTHLNRLVAALGYAATARRLCVHEKTVKRWHTKQTKPYAFIGRLIELDARDAFGDLPPPWQRWRIAPDGLLYEWDGDARGYTPADLRGLWHLRAHAAHMEREIMRLKSRIEELQNQPMTVTLPDLSKLSKVR